MAVNKILILGFEEGSVSFLVEAALEMGSFNRFEIILNTKDVPENPRIATDDQFISITHANDFKAQEINKIPVHFGVLHAHIKYILYQYFLHHFNIKKSRYHSFVHPLAYFPKSSRYKQGFYIGQLSAVTSFSSFGFGVTIKKSCSIGHHSEFGDYVTINPGSTVAGYVHVGSGTEIGTGATISNNITIGKNCLIGAGSVVTKDIPDGVIAYGNPCKVIRENERWLSTEDRLKGMLNKIS